MKCELTEEQLDNLYKYKELINSCDIECVKLGINLFYSDFCKFKCPYKCYKSLIYLDSVEFKYEKLNKNRLNLDDLYGPSRLRYWQNHINSLIVKKCYFD